MSHLFQENGGHLALTRDWAKGLLRRMGFDKRSVSLVLHAEEGPPSGSVSLVMHHESIPQLRA